MLEMNSRTSDRGDFAGMSLRDLAAPLFRQKRSLIIAFCSVFAIATIVGLLRMHTYESHMAILVSRERMDPLVSTEAASQVVTMNPALTSEEVNSEAELLKSRDVLEKVVVSNGMQNGGGNSLLNFLRPSQTQADRIARSVRSLAEHIKVETGAKTNLIQLSYRSTDPRLAYGVLDSLGNVYLEKHAAVHRPPGSYLFFAQQTQSYKTALDESEARLRAFGSSHGVSDPEDQRRDISLQLAAAVGQLHGTQQTIAAEEERIKSDDAQMKIMPSRSDTRQETAAASLLLQNLGTSLLAAETKRTQLLLKYEPTYPLVQEADQEVAEAKAAIDHAEKAPYVNQTTDRDPTFELLREDLARNRADLAGQRASLAANRASITSMQGQMVTLGDQALTLADLQRDSKANEQNYLLYLSKREQERASDALDHTRIENVAIAVPPAIPALPVHGTAYVLLLAIGLAASLSLAGAYVVDYLDPSFHTPAQVAQVLKIPVVVSVPKRSA
jgi:succinoglycan biosynthesis transport protein ExoP